MDLIKEFLEEKHSQSSLEIVFTIAKVLQVDVKELIDSKEQK